MNDLFDYSLARRLTSEAPLAARMRPRYLDEFIGQDEIVGAGKLLRRAIESDRLFSSIILWGPPGTGKTTLAMVIANMTRSHFATLSAVLAGKAELRMVIDQALERRKLYQKKTVLFVTHSIDEAVYLADRIVVLSGCPGCVREIIPVSISRPRNLQIKDEPEFVRMRRHIWGLLEQEAHRQAGGKAAFQGSFVSCN